LRDIKNESSRIDPELGLDKGLAALALTLVDGEVAFSWIATDSEPASRKDSETVAKLCSSEAVDATAADFVFAASGIGSVVEAFLKAKEGDLVDPDRGATVIALADALMAGGPLVARGPGIKDAARFTVEFGDGRSEDWMDARAGRNVEFPLGVDLILVDRSGRLMAFPRSVKLGRA